MKRSQPQRRHALLALLGFAIATAAFAQIGGEDSSAGPFVLDDAEDLDLTADGVMRDWISDYVYPSGFVLSVVDLGSTALTLAPDQSPVGALQMRAPASFGFIDAGFGVPMPAVDGASTLDSPGDITSFEKLTFLARYGPNIPDLTFFVILETYPGPDHPKIFWSFQPAQSNGFERVEIDLRSPVLVENAGSLTLEELLAQTRYLAFHASAGPLFFPQTLELHIDDIRLEGVHLPPEPFPVGLHIR